MKSRPTVKVISSATLAAEAEVDEALLELGRQPLVPVHNAPWERPSKLTVPIMVHSSATVPAPASSLGAPASGGRTYSSRVRQCSGESIENRRK